MIRTRDFLLYVLVFVFILMGISFTLSSERNNSLQFTTNEEEINTVQGSDIEVGSESEEIDRASIIASLRKKIARGEGQIIQGEPVFTSVDSITSTETISEGVENPDVLGEVDGRSPNYCTEQNTFESAVSNLSRNETEMLVYEGARVVRVEKTTSIAVGSSTVSTTTKVILLQMSVTPVRGLTSNCLDSEVMGIAFDGSAIKNNETWRFRNVPAQSIVGYARDGFPIFGQGIDESVLDECGGYDTGSGYQYHLREKELFILGCYAATPAVFFE